MAIVAKATGGGTDFVPAPAGVHAGVCVDVVDLGILEVNFGGKQKKQHKVRIVWQIDEVMADNKPYIASKRYTLSLHEKSTLRKDLESWRGRGFTPEELEGFDLENLIGIPCFLSILHAIKEGQTYSNVTSIMRLPKNMETPKPRDYVRVIDRAPQAAQAPTEPQQEEPWTPTDDDVPF